MINAILKKTLLIDFYGSLLTEKQREVYKMHYEEDLSISEIASIQNISRQAASEMIKKTERILDEYEKKLKLLSKFEKMDILIDKLDLILNDNNKLNKDALNKIRNDLEKIRG